MQRSLVNCCQAEKERMRRNQLYIIASITFVLFILSCNKDHQTDNGSLYGEWKTSYGDTIVFARENGKDILTYNMSTNTVMPPVDTKNEYSYQNNKLGIKDGLNGSDFRVLQTFSWNQPGRSFTVQAVEWFLFVNSTNTYFTFTKIH